MLRKNYLCDFQRPTFDKNDHENILMKKVQHEPVLKTRNCIFLLPLSIYAVYGSNEMSSLPQFADWLGNSVQTWSLFKIKDS